MDSPWLTFAEIVIAAAILVYLFFRPRRDPAADAHGVPRIEVKLSGGELTPPQVRVPMNRPAQLVITRFDTEPDEELIEVDDLQIYALLPALHATIIPFNPQQRGSFPMVLGGDREAGTMIVE